METSNFWVNSFLWFRINYSRNGECFDQSCENRTETVYETLRLLFLLSPIVWNMCENLQYELVYFKELHNEQEYYWPAIHEAGAALVSTVTSYCIVKVAVD